MDSGQVHQCLLFVVLVLPFLSEQPQALLTLAQELLSTNFSARSDPGNASFTDENLGPLRPYAS